MKTTRVLVLFVLAIGLCSARAQVTVPNVINYQGKLMSGTNLFSGTVPIAFRLFDAPSGSAMPHCVDSNDVVVVDGLYSTYIGDNVTGGSLENALIQTQVWIEVVIGTNVIAPREQLVSVGYARYAAGLPANAILSHHIRDGEVFNWHLAGGTVGGLYDPLDPNHRLVIVRFFLDAGVPRVYWVGKGGGTVNTIQYSSNLVADAFGNTLHSGPYFGGIAPWYKTTNTHAWSAAEPIRLIRIRTER